MVSAKDGVPTLAKAMADAHAGPPRSVFAGHRLLSRTRLLPFLVHYAGSFKDNTLSFGRWGTYEAYFCFAPCLQAVLVDDPTKVGYSTCTWTDARDVFRYPDTTVVIV
jgi:hypothetical protein